MTTTTLAANNASARPARALLLDGDLRALHALAVTLEARGLDVLAATDGHAGLDLLLEELLGLDVLVVDLDLPGRDGAAMLELVRRAGGERDLAVVVLASLAGRGLRARLARMGADAVVDRAEGPAAVAEAVERIIARRDAAAAGLEGVGARMAGGLRELLEGWAVEPVCVAA
jgi:DNA-binding response OmpR family regulator